MTSTSAFWLLALGFVLGLRHAFDADHLAAVSTMTGGRGSLFGSSLIGALWGLGHTISLMIAGVLVMLLHFQISERTTRALEFCVGLMLIGLGVNALQKLVRGGHVHMHQHEHRGRWHVHPHLHAGKHEDEPLTHHGMKLSARPLLIGLVHGMAGSAALTLLVLTTIPSPLFGFIYIGIFGIGSIGGMMIMSTLFALPARLTARRFTRADLVLRGLAASFSFSFGAVMVYDIGFVDHFLM